MAVLCTVIWDIKPECADDLVRTLSDMFSDTQTHDGFISIRLQKSAIAANAFILLQEWETISHHQAYMAYRGEQGDMDKLAAMTAGPTLIQYWDVDPLASA